MNKPDTPLTVTIEREFPYPPERLWRALTEPHLLSEWLMQTDFIPEVGHTFRFDADWGSVDCRIREIQPERHLVYTWGDGVMDTVVTWTLTPTPTGTRLMMVQSGFPKDAPRYYGGAKQGWPRFFDALGDLLERQEAS